VPDPQPIVSSGGFDLLAYVIYGSIVAGVLIGLITMSVESYRKSVKRRRWWRSYEETTRR